MNRGTVVQLHAVERGATEDFEVPNLVANN
jgi:hypothetical protein